MVFWSWFQSFKVSKFQRFPQSSNVFKTLLFHITKFQFHGEDGYELAKKELEGYVGNGAIVKAGGAVIEKPYGWYKGALKGLLGY